MIPKKLVRRLYLTITKIGIKSIHLWQKDQVSTMIAKEDI